MTGRTSHAIGACTPRQDVSRAAASRATSLNGTHQARIHHWSRGAVPPPRCRVSCAAGGTQGPLDAATPRSDDSGQWPVPASAGGVDRGAHQCPARLAGRHHANLGFQRRSRGVGRGPAGQAQQAVLQVGVGRNRRRRPEHTNLPPLVGDRRQLLPHTGHQLRGQRPVRTDQPRDVPRAQAAERGHLPQVLPDGEIPEGAVHDPVGVGHLQHGRAGAVHDRGEGGRGVPAEQVPVVRVCADLLHRPSGDQVRHPGVVVGVGGDQLTQRRLPVGSAADVRRDRHFPLSGADLPDHPVQLPVGQDEDVLLPRRSHLATPPRRTGGTRAADRPGPVSSDRTGADRQDSGARPPPAEGTAVIPRGGTGV